MRENGIIVLVGICVGFLQALVIFILVGLRADIKDLWKRMYSHYHEIDCSNSECDVRRTGNVIVPHDTA